MKYVLDFLLRDSVHLTITAAMLVMLKTSTVTSRYNKHVFCTLLVTNLFFLITDYVDTAIRDYPVAAQLPSWAIQLRTVSAALCYLFKAMELLILMVALIAPRGKRLLLMTVPAAVAGGISLISIFNGCLFTITPQNIYLGGPLKWLYMVIIFSYFIFLPLFSLLSRNDANPVRITTVLLISGLMLVTTVAGLAEQYKFNLAGMSIIVSIMLYFLFDFMERSNSVIEDKDRQLQLQQIELANSQIQPHFLYNTLSVVCGLCRLDPAKAEQTLIDFSNYLRGSLNHTKSKDPMIPIEKELEHTRFYTNIEQTRFRHLTVEYDIQDGGYFVPFLTVQPMVENAIRHGVRGIPGGKVTVTLQPFAQGDATLHRIIVSDNGTGKPLDSSPDDHKGIGIANVTNRIQTLCNGTVQIDFSPTGTTVVIQLPDTWHSIGGTPSTH